MHRFTKIVATLGPASSDLATLTRLVEAGVRMVSVTFGGWDHHSNIKSAFDGQAPNFDQAFARLITDLADRGMLKRTLGIAQGNFAALAVVVLAKLQQCIYTLVVILAAKGLQLAYVLFLYGHVLQSRG